MSAVKLMNYAANKVAVAIGSNGSGFSLYELDASSKSRFQVPRSQPGFLSLSRAGWPATVKVTKNQHWSDFAAKGYRLAGLYGPFGASDAAIEAGLQRLANGMEPALRTYSPGYLLAYACDWTAWCRFVAPARERIANLHTAHRRAIDTLAGIGKNGMMSRGREDHILIREKNDSNGKYYELGLVILGGPKPHTVPTTTLRIIADDKSVVGVCHLHFNGGWLSGSDFRSAIADGISISAVDMQDRKAEVFIPNFDRGTNNAERWNFAKQWENNYINSTSGPGEVKDALNDKRFYYAPAGYEKYIPDGSYYDLNVK